MEKNQLSISYPTQPSRSGPQQPGLWTLIAEHIHPLPSHQPQIQEIISPSSGWPVDCLFA